MILRFIKFAWAISLVGGLATLLYVYASLPEQVVYSLSNTYIPKGAIPRESFFYITLAFLAAVNFLLYALSRNLRYKQKSISDLLKKWQMSLALVLNVFFIIALNFIQLVNSGEDLNYNYFGILIYVILALIFIWVFALPILMIRAYRSKK